MSKESLIEKLESLEARYHDIGTQLGDPSVIADQKRFQQLNKAYKDLQEIVEATVQYRNMFNNIQEAREVLNNDKDEDFRNMDIYCLYRENHLGNSEGIPEQRET